MTSAPPWSLTSALIIMKRLELSWVINIVMMNTFLNKRVSSSWRISPTSVRFWTSVLRESQITRNMPESSVIYFRYAGEISSQESLMKALWSWYELINACSQVFPSWRRNPRMRWSSALRPQTACLRWVRFSRRLWLSSVLNLLCCFRFLWKRDKVWVSKIFKIFHSEKTH